MEYCGPRGIAYDEFQTWSSMSRNSALAWVRENQETCHCGTRRDEWNEEKGGKRNAYVAVQYICPGCRAVEEAYETAHDDAKRTKRKTHGLKVNLIPLDVHKRRMEARRNDPKYREREKRRREEAVYGEAGLDAKTRRQQRKEAAEQRQKQVEESAYEPEPGVEED